MGTTIERYQNDVRASAGNALAGAFEDDPMMQHMWPDIARRRRALPAYFGSVLDLSAPRGVVHVARDGAMARGAIVAMPPGTYPLPLVPQLLQVRTILASGWRALVSNFTDVPRVDALRPRFPYWYVMYLGVAPDAQGEGIGAALLDEALADADAAGLPAYLVTMKEANVAWYERAGFAVRDRTTYGRSGPDTWTLLRQGGA